MRDDNPLLEGLNSPQREAVLHVDGPLLILAGAGSGKTRVMTHRLANIIKYHGVKPSHILAVTFTNKAANEMKERVEALLKSPLRQTRLPYLGTFHSVCARVLRQEYRHTGIPSTFSILDEEDQVSLIKEIMKKKHMSPEELSPRVIISIISRAKDDLIGPDDFVAGADSPVYEKVADIYPSYQKNLAERGALDFGDLLYQTVLLFRNNKDVLTRYQDKFQYILVDEYQDTNHAQYDIIKNLASKSKNIAVCGDDDQSIYAWRGATVRNILSFEEDYPDAKVIKLEQNYRSTQKILDAAYSVIKNNISRKEKRLWTENPKGNSIIRYTADDEEDEASFVAKKIEEYSEDESLQEIAVLYRTNAQSRNFEEAMIRYQIPYRIVGGFRFYQRKEIKDILAYVRLLVNPEDSSALFRVINTPPRGIGNKTLARLRDLSEISKASPARIAHKVAHEDPSDKTLELEKQVFEHPGIRKFSKLINNLSKKTEKMPAHEVVKYIIQKTNYIKLLELDKKESQSRIENLEELINAASRYKELPGKEGLHNFITDIALMEKEDNSEEAIRSRISLMTLHSAKGLEFNVVFLVGAEEGLLPHTNSLDTNAELEEERRLCYVGITRTKKQLFITNARQRTLYGKRFDSQPSRFLYEIPDSLIEECEQESYSKHKAYDDKGYDLEPDPQASSVSVIPGDRVKHPEFGTGTVESVEEDLIYVLFANKEKKAFVAEYAHLQKL